LAEKLNRIRMNTKNNSISRNSQKTNLIVAIQAVLLITSKKSIIPTSKTGIGLKKNRTI
jgi:hypothetical protein